MSETLGHLKSPASDRALRLYTHPDSALSPQEGTRLGAPDDLRLKKWPGKALLFMWRYLLEKSLALAQPLSSIFSYPRRNTCS